MSTFVKKTVVKRECTVTNGVKTVTVTSSTIYEGCTEDEFNKAMRLTEELNAWPSRWVRDLFKGFDVP